MSIRSLLRSRPEEVAACIMLSLVVIVAASLAFAATVFLVGTTLGFDMSYMTLQPCSAAPARPWPI